MAGHASHDLNANARQDSMLLYKPSRNNVAEGPVAPYSISICFLFPICNRKMPTETGNGEEIPL